MVVVRVPHHAGSGSWQLPWVLPEGLVPSYSSCTHQRLWAHHAGLTSLLLHTVGQGLVQQTGPRAEGHVCRCPWNTGQGSHMSWTCTGLLLPPL